MSKKMSRHQLACDIERRRMSSFEVTLQEHDISTITDASKPNKQMNQLQLRAKEQRLQRMALNKKAAERKKETMDLSSKKKAPAEKTSSKKRPPSKVI